MEKLSAIVITFNEERNIGACLDALKKVADEIIVVDNGSSDDTPHICINNGAAFITQSWLGYGSQRNFAASKATHKYILALDADEVLNSELIKNILILKTEGFTEKVYRLPRLNFFYGKFITHGMGNHDIKARLYDRTFAKWNDKLVHEILEFPKNIKPITLKGFIEHYTYRSISEHLIKTDRYTSLAAQEYFKKGKRKPGFIKLVLSPMFAFISAYILKVGFLDGWHGWILAKIHTNSVLQKYAKLRILYDESKP